MTFKLSAAKCLDAYKLGHMKQYPEGTTLVYSNFTARSDRLLNTPIELKGKIVWAGIQGTLKELVELWDETFFKLPWETVAINLSNSLGAFTGEHIPDIEHLHNLHKLQYLPILVKALPEGSLVNIGVPLFTIHNTLPEFGWLTNMLETHLSNESWKIPTTATVAYASRHIFKKYAELTGANKEFILWQGHNFADRGMSGMMDAAKSGFGHLLSFLGTDSVSSVDWVKWAYPDTSGFIGGSVPATEHSVMCMGGEGTEVETIRRLVTEIYPKGVVSVVSDTWDFWKVINEYAVELKDEILAREPDDLGLAKVVFRPDSGNPVDIVCGEPIRNLGEVENIRSALYEAILKDVFRLHCKFTPLTATGLTWTYKLNGSYYEVKTKHKVDWNSYSTGNPFDIISYDEIQLTPERKGAIECLYDIFGGTKNEKGYITLNPRVGLIYGDSITLERQEEILRRLSEKGFASDNIVLGLGSFSYQYNTRDTLGFAMKATYGEVKGVGRELYKDPVTDVGKTKKSAKGLLRVEREGDNFVLYDQQTWDQTNEGWLSTVFYNGFFTRTTTLDKIRDRLYPVVKDWRQTLV